MSKQDVQDLQQKYRPTTSKIQQYISLNTWGTFYPCVHQTHLDYLLLKKLFYFISSDHRSQLPLKFQLCLMAEYALSLFMSLFLDELEFFLKPSQTTCGDVGAV